MTSERVPKCIADCLTALRDERTPLAARLDAIDLAIDNLSRVYGVHGTPQPLPIERRAKPARKPRAVADGEPDAPRDLLLNVLGKSELGLTLAELRKVTPKMDGKARSNALQRLKQAGQIERAGNAWKIAA